MVGCAKTLPAGRSGKSNKKRERLIRHSLLPFTASLLKTGFFQRLDQAFLFFGEFLGNFDAYFY